MFRKKINGKIIIIIGILIFLLIISIALLIKHTGKIKLITEGQKFKESYVVLYEFENGTKLYSQYSEVYVRLKNNKIKLADALNNGTIIMENIVSKSDASDEANDGGSVKYTFSKENLSIIYCKTIDGINDIYIVDSTKNVSVCKKR